MKKSFPFMADEQTPALERLRCFLLWLFGLGALGTGAELLLIGHTEDSWQLAPLALLGLSVAVFASLVVSPRRASLRAFRVLMVFFVASAFIGVYQHYRANAEFELEMYPSLGGVELLWESLRGALPALAPGTMALLGLLGMASTYRHPKGESP